MLDLTAYENGGTYLDLYAKLQKIKETNKPLIVVDNNGVSNNNLCSPINASLLYDDGWFGISYLVFDSVIQIEIEADGNFTKVLTPLSGE